MSEGPEVHEAEEAHEGLKHEAYIVSVDIGTTSLRSHIYDNHGHIKASSSKKIELIYPKPGWSEMDPELLYTQMVACVAESIKGHKYTGVESWNCLTGDTCISAAGIKVSDVTCLGIAVQRNTCLTWDRETGKPYHNFVTWQDLRARDYVKSWNSSVTLKALNSGSKFLHTFTRKKRFLSASVLKFMSPQVTLRLLWLLDNIPDLRKKASDGLVMFGCIESWLLWKLTGSQVHATDYSCASATGLYDPFQVGWSTIVCGLVNIPMNIFPEVLPTSGLFGHVEEAVFGSSIPITCLVGDQSASMFGECCFDVGDIKCTLGTGMFINLNTGENPHASIAGLYPLVGWQIGDKVTYIAEGIATDAGSVINWAQKLGLYPIIGWKIGDKLTYMAEGGANDAGTVINWAQQMGYFDDVRETASIAESVEDTDGVYFVPAFSGLQAPINDDKATSLMIGMQPSTTKAHITRAILESIGFRFKLLYETVLNETKIPLSFVRVDGGVCNNDFLVQLMSDLTNQVINRSTQTENMSSLGTAFFAGLAMGVWKDFKELEKIRVTEREFEPQQNWPKYKPVFHQWERAVSRSQRWYED